MTDSKKPTTRAQTMEQLSETVGRLVALEEVRAEERRKAVAETERALEFQKEARITTLFRSIEMIKWCVLGISTVMATSIVILVFIVAEVQSEAERIKDEVEQIKIEAELIRERIRHPLESLAGSLGRKLDSGLIELITSRQKEE